MRDGSEGGTYTTVWIALAVKVSPLCCAMRPTFFSHSAGDNRAKVAKSKWMLILLENCMRANWWKGGGGGEDVMEQDQATHGCLGPSPGKGDTYTGVGALKPLHDLDDKGLHPLEVRGADAA